MVALTSLWLPILLSAVLVWIASAIAWTVLPHHKKDFRGLPDEDAVRSALRMQNLTPGQYMIPKAHGGAAMKDPEVARKFVEGPVGYLTVVAPGAPSMGKAMALSFVNYVVVGVVVAYLAGRTLPAGTDYLQVFRVVGTAAWLAHGFALLPDAIWFGRPWSTTGKSLIDALVYGLLTAGVFGWLWPAA